MKKAMYDDLYILVAEKISDLERLRDAKLLTISNWTLGDIEPYENCVNACRYLGKTQRKINHYKSLLEEFEKEYSESK